VNKFFFISIILFVSLNAKDEFAIYLQKEIKTFNNNETTAQPKRPIQS